MKRIALLMLLPVLAIGQKKVGAVYHEHPAYDVVTESYRVWESGTEEELRALYTEDAKIWGPGDKEADNMDGEVQVCFGGKRTLIFPLPTWIRPSQTSFSTKARKVHGH